MTADWFVLVGLFLKKKKKRSHRSTSLPQERQKWDRNLQSYANEVTFLTNKDIQQAGVVQTACLYQSRLAGLVHVLPKEGEYRLSGPKDPTFAGEGLSLTLKLSSVDLSNLARSLGKHLTEVAERAAARDGNNQWPIKVYEQVVHMLSRLSSLLGVVTCLDPSHLFRNISSEFDDRMVLLVNIRFTGRGYQG